MDYFPSYCINNSHPFHFCQFCQYNQSPIQQQSSTDSQPKAKEIQSQPKGTKSTDSQPKGKEILSQPIEGEKEVAKVFLGFPVYPLADYATNLGITIIIPSLLAQVAGGGNVEQAEAIQASLFVMGINSLLQIYFGTRLPVIMGVSQAFTIPAISIALSANIANLNPTLTPRQRFELSMRRIQGASLIASFLQMIIGFSGLGKIFARHLSPLATAPFVTLTGLGLYAQGFPELAKCIEIGLPALIFLVFSTQFLPLIWKSKKEIIVGFSVMLPVAIIWAYAEILTVSGAYDNTSQETQMNCSADRSGLINAAPWIKIPRPFQWGLPTFEAGDALSMMAAAFVAVIESSGTFYATSRILLAKEMSSSSMKTSRLSKFLSRLSKKILLKEKPKLCPTALGRGIGIQGIGTLVDAVFGIGRGSSASVEHAGTLGLNPLNSTVIAFLYAILMLVLSLLGKFAVVISTIPMPILAAMNTILIPYVASAGLGYLQFCNLNSFRSKFILGFSLFMGLSVPQYFKEYRLVSSHGPVHTGSIWFNDSMQVIFSSPPTIAIIVSFFLDRTHSRGECSTWRDNGSWHLEELMRKN